MFRKACPEGRPRTGRRARNSRFEAEAALLVEATHTAELDETQRSRVALIRRDEHSAALRDEQRCRLVVEGAGAACVVARLPCHASRRRDPDADR